MTCGLTNTPAAFQAYLDDCLQPYIDDFTMCYLEDILIYSTNEKEHEDHVRKVLQCLQEFGLYCKAEKCQFGVCEVGFLGFVINPDGIGMESDRISTMEDWPTPESVRDVQVLLGFPNFYRRFIQKYAMVTAPISTLLKTQGSRKWEWTRDAELTSRKLKKAFPEAPILQHFNPANTDHSASRRMRLHNHRHPQPVRLIGDASPSQFLLSKMLPRRTELHHVRSGALGDCRDNETMETLSCGR
jgi:hypothetical protein